ncbi:HTH domain-containing protein [Haematospirillum jordaniae]|uniref:helix-turn-helix domain-containing protein n=1 Tax=Haematospirillum jordaniae TaxID=1549855 RepID=UPI00143296CC|nr:helix-turn-helix domain-containing protein [Haematospirillum jordaniae]NKD86312.1 HTH domain-containing protein [Haematospirillum jordaniae]
MSVSQYRAVACAKPAPTGHVRKAYGHFDAAAAVATFKGIPEGINHPKQLLEPFRRCGNHLPFPREALSTLELLFDYSSPKDWTSACSPLVFPGNAELAGCLGVSERTIRNHLSALEKAGFISIERGPGNRRTPVRAADGSIVSAYGINLAPVIEKHTEFQSVAQELKAQRNSLKSQRRSIGAALQDIRTAVDALDVLLWEHSDDTSLQKALDVAKPILLQSEQIFNQFLRLYNSFSSATAEEQIRFEQDILNLEKKITDYAGHVHMLTWSCMHNLYEFDSGHQETNFHHISTKENKTKNSSAKKVVSLTDLSSEPLLPYLTEVKPLTSLQRSQTDLLKNFCTPLSAVITSQFLESPEEAKPDDWFQAARILAHQLGVSEWAWKTGCQQHGPLQVTFAVAVAAIKPQEYIYKSRQAFLAGMLLRPSGQLNALASFHALRKREKV